MVAIEKVAEFIVAFGTRIGSPTTHLKLQKLLYYVEAYHLAIHGRPFTGARFEAWPHGPVSPKIWSLYRVYGNSQIQADSYSSLTELADEALSHILMVLERYYLLSSSQLESLTHGEAPWRKARAHLSEHEASNRCVRPSDMQQFYKSFVSSSQRAS
jgi:uncharacterized phage-associated protein